MTDPFTFPGDTTDAFQVQSPDGTVRHIPDPGPPTPHMLWNGEMTPDWVAFIRRGNGPYWIEGKDTLVVSQGTDTPEEENLHVRPGEWLTWLGGEYGFEEGVVFPIYIRVGWQSPESLLGWIMDTKDVPGLLRSMADNWNTEEAVAG